MAKKRTDPRAGARDAVLRSWIALERFDTKTLDAPDRVGGGRRGTYAVDVGPNEPLAWEPGHVAFGQPPVSDRVEWRHTLHLGQYDVGAAYERVEAAFPDAETSRELRRPTRKPAPLLALAVTSDGRPIMDSLQVSSAAWSIARTLRLGVDDAEWLVGFEDAVSEVRGAFERIVIGGPRGASRDALRDGAGAGPSTDAEPVGRAAASAEGADVQRPSDDTGPEVDAESDVEPPADASANAVNPPASDADADAEPPADAIDDDNIGVAPVTWEVLLRLMGAATKILETEGQLVIRPVARTTSWQESKRVPYGNGDTLLNSFAVDDLERVAWRMGEHAPGQALARYLDASHVAETEAGERIDVDAELGEVRGMLEPRRLPAGRWPADAAHDLALGQQLAVNVATSGVLAPSVVAVNGPPGTGKTTMLRDLIAAVVTERAQVMAGFEDPSELFVGTAESVSGDRVTKVHKVNPKLVGREILLACATNAAAQNVSLELPDARAIDREWQGGGGYLADFATAALRVGAASDARAGGGRDARESGRDGRGGPAADEAWGLIAARLGRRSYCKDFAGAVWWGASPRPGDRGAGGAGAAGSIAPTERAAAGLGRLLAASQNAAGKVEWKASRDRFRVAHAAVEELRAERQTRSEALRPAGELEAALAGSETELLECDAELDRLDAERARAAAAAGDLVSAHAAAKARLAELGEAPAKHVLGRLSVVAREQAGQRKDAERAATQARKVAADALDDVRRSNRKLDRARDAATSAERRRDDARDQLAARTAAVAENGSGADAAAGRTPFVVPGDAWMADQTLRDGRAPWCDEAWNRARTECFLAALDLHEATLLVNGRDTRRNLAAAFDLLSGRVNGLARQVTLAAWQTLFLLVPVVSTTFASLPTLLSGLGQEDLGWLLIDEAGQAQPQQAVGAIWRCKRAVIVGDPLQLEPVSALPSSLADAIRARYEVPREYVSPEASVQRLADAVTPWGAARGDDDLWVGVPMNVHRRCEGPIFDLVNAIAYGGRMVNATVPRPVHPSLSVETCWLDVPGGGGSDGHWIPGEGDRLDALLAHLWRGGYDFGQVFAVSPFRDVARHLRYRADDPAHRGMTGGTIHTIQGREADTVILVLGGNPSKPGARDWVAAKPNLLNVAASRARQRLYVIGDHDAWIDLPYFTELRGLRRVAPRRAPVA